jgi:hypothetical protein
LETCPAHQMMMIIACTVTSSQLCEWETIPMTLEKRKLWN